MVTEESLYSPNRALPEVPTPTAPDAHAPLSSTKSRVPSRASTYLEAKARRRPHRAGGRPQNLRIFRLGLFRYAGKI